MTGLKRILALGVTLLIPASVSAGIITIDDFSVDQTIGTVGPSGSDIAVGVEDASILGGQRDVQLVRNPVATNTSNVSGGKMTWTFLENSSSSGFINNFVSYDGVDNNFARFPQFSPGLSSGGAGFDFTQGGILDAFEFDLGTISENLSQGLRLLVQVQDDSASFGTSQIVLTDAMSNTSLQIPFSSFTGRDFENIRNVMFFIGGGAFTGQAATVEFDAFRAVPEPASILLLAAGGLSLMLRRRR